MCDKILIALSFSAQRETAEDNDPRRKSAVSLLCVVSSFRRRLIHKAHHVIIDRGAVNKNCPQI